MRLISFDFMWRKLPPITKIPTDKSEKSHYDSRRSKAFCFNFVVNKTRNAPLRKETDQLMKHALIFATLAALCAFAPMSLAQETTTEEAVTEESVTDETATEEAVTETAEQAEPETTQLDDEFPVAEDSDEPKEGQLYVREAHGSWEVRCVKAAGDEPEACRLYQLLQDQNGASVAEIDFQKLPEGGKAVAGVDFASPLGTLLTEQVVMRIDSGKAKKYQFGWCDQYGCFSRFGLTGEELANLKKGANAHITIVSVALPEEPINLTVSLTGFTAAWNALGE